MPTVTVEWRAYSAPFSLFYSLSTLLHLGPASPFCISILHLHPAPSSCMSACTSCAAQQQHFKSLQLHLLRIISAETVNKINFWFLTNKKLQSPISDSQVLNFRISRGWLLVLSIGGCLTVEWMLSNRKSMSPLPRVSSGVAGSFQTFPHWVSCEISI